MFTHAKVFESTKYGQGLVCIDETEEGDDCLLLRVMLPDVSGERLKCDVRLSAGGKVFSDSLEEAVKMMTVEAFEKALDKAGIPALAETLRNGG